MIFTLAKEHKYAGTFSQRKILWSTLEQFEGKEPTPDLQPILTLVVQTLRENIRTDKGNFSTLTYTNLCTALRNAPKVGLYDSETLVPVYGIWQSEMNQLYEDNEPENVPEENTQNENTNVVEEKDEDNTPIAAPPEKDKDEIGEDTSLPLISSEK